MGDTPMLEPLTIVVRELPHIDQRYETVGDWFKHKDGMWEIRASNLGRWQYAFLVALHELVEMALCEDRGVSEKAVTDFDIQFEQDRDPGDESEPGHDPRAPYHREHVFAEQVEKLVAAELGVDWDEYEKKVLEMSQ